MQQHPGRSQTPAGGVVGLHGSPESARKKAEDHMREACPFGYSIVVEGDAEIAYACKPALPEPAQAPRETGVHI
jgi:hypothetical protein